MVSPKCFLEKKFVKGEKPDDITRFDGIEMVYLITNFRSE
jgi:hypothetical protein